MTNLPSIEASPLRSFIDRFEAWRGSLPEKVLGYFSEDAVIDLCGTAGLWLARKWWRSGHPHGDELSRQCPPDQNFLEASDQVAVEWLFTGAHVSTGREINIQGCSIYWVNRGLIRRGQLYFNSPQAKRDQGLSVLDHTHHSDRLSQAVQQAPSGL